MIGVELVVFLVPVLVVVIALTLFIYAVFYRNRVMAYAGVLALLLSGVGMIAYFVAFGGAV